MTRTYAASIAPPAINAFCTRRYSKMKSPIRLYGNLCFVLAEEKKNWNAFCSRSVCSIGALGCEPPRDTRQVIYKRGSGEEEKVACWMRKRKIDESSFGFSALTYNIHIVAHCCCLVRFLCEAKEKPLTIHKMFFSVVFCSLKQHT